MRVDLGILGTGHLVGRHLLLHHLHLRILALFLRRAHVVKVRNVEWGFIHVVVMAPILLRLDLAISTLIVVLCLMELLRLTLLDGNLPVLSPHVFIVVMGAAHDLLLTSLLARRVLLDRSVEVTILALVLRQFSRRKEPSVTGHNVVICAVLGLKATEKDVVLFELMAL